MRVSPLVACSRHRGLLEIDDDRPVGQHAGGGAGRDDGRRVELLDDGRAGDDVAGAQRAALVERRVVLGRRPVGAGEDDRRPAGERLGGRLGVPGCDDARADRRHEPDRVGPHVDDLHRLLGEAVEVLALVGLLEALGERDERRVVQRPGRHGHEQLVRLADVAAVGPALEHAVRLGDVVGVERRAPVDLQLGEDGVELGRVGVRRLDHDGPLLLVLEVGVQQAHRRGDAGVRRDDDPGDGQLACDVRAVERPAAAERDEAEVARVEALLHAVDADRVDHVLGQDLRDAQRRARDVEAERLPEGCDRGAGAVDVELEIAREARAAAHAAEHRLRVGRGGLGARRGRSRPVPDRRPRSAARRAAGRRRRRGPASRRRRRSCRGRPSGSSPRSRRGSCRRGASSARRRPARRRCPPRSRPRRA